MNVTLKLAILKSGKRQWQIAREADIHESRLSKFVQGYGRLNETEKRRLEVVLGVQLDQATSVGAEK
jgi:inorganic triphosphatase YgiF